MVHVNNEILWIIVDIVFWKFILIRYNRNRCLLNNYLFSILVFHFDKIYFYFLKFMLAIILELDNLCFEMNLDLLLIEMIS